MEDRIGEKYRIISKLGAGGNGTVFLAEDEVLQRKAAIKRISAEAGMDEMRLLLELDHPCLTKIYDMMCKEQELYIIMEYVEGISLKEKVEKGKGMSESEAWEIALQILEVLAYLHEEKQIVYQDLKPSNIIVKPNGRIKLIDFGTAFYKSHNGFLPVVAGTVGYAAPEQLAGSGMSIDNRSDIYAFGAVLYSMLTGISLDKPPYEMVELRTFFPQLSEKTIEIIEKCTAAKKEKRFSSVGEIKETYNRPVAKRRRRNKGKYYQRKKDVFLTAKKGAGLWFVLWGILFAAVSMQGTEMSGQGAKRTLPVHVREEDGREVLLQHDAVYGVDERMIFEIPGSAFSVEKPLILTVRVDDEKGSLSGERRFLVRRK